MAFAAAGFAKSFARPKATQTAGTVITSVVRPVGDKKTKLTLFLYADLGTAHNLVWMAPLAKTTVFAAAAGAATTLVLTRDPGNYSANATADGKATPSVANNLLAANDYLIVRMPDGNFTLVKPSAVASPGTDGSVSTTVSALPTGGILAGADAWFMGIYTDTNPRTGEAHFLITGATGSVTTTYGDGSYSLTESPGMNEPLLFYSDNVTNAGTLHRAYGYYGP